jgi:hypothetical protein
VFDVKAVRRALETRVKVLEAEKQQVSMTSSAVSCTQAPLMGLSTVH